MLLFGLSFLWCSGSYWVESDIFVDAHVPQFAEPPNMERCTASREAARWAWLKTQHFVWILLEKCHLPRANRREETMQMCKILWEKCVMTSVACWRLRRAEGSSCLPVWIWSEAVWSGTVCLSACEPDRKVHGENCAFMHVCGWVGKKVCALQLHLDATALVASDDSAVVLNATTDASNVKKASQPELSRSTRAYVGALTGTLRPAFDLRTRRTQNILVALESATCQNQSRDRIFWFWFILEQFGPERVPYKTVSQKGSFQKEDLSSLFFSKTFEF